MQKILHILFLLLAFHVYKLGAQTQLDRWTSYIEPGLVNDYLEEADKLYVATDAGVFVMDKTTRTVLEHWTKRSVGIPSNRVESIRRDAATNRIFIGTYDIAALTVQNPDGSWENIPYPEVLTVNNAGNPVMTYCLEFDDQNRAWVGTSHGLLRYDATAGEGAWTLINEANFSNFFSSVWDMAKTPDGRLLFGSHLLFGANGDEVELLSPLGPNNNPFSELFSYSDAKVHAQADGTIWFFTDVGSYGRFDGNEWEVTTNADQPDITFHGLNFVTEDATGALWANLGWQGFVRYDAENGTWEFAEPVADTQLEEPTGLCFTENGLVLFEQGKMEWHDAAGAVLGTTNLGNYPFDGLIWRMESDQEGSLWSLESNHTGRVRNLESGIFIDVIINGEPVYLSDFAFTNEGKLWAISGKRVVRQTESGWEYFDYTNSDLPDSYGFSQMTIDSDGRAWIAVYEKGLYRYDDANGWKNFNNPAIVQNYIIDLEAGQNGQLWVSSWYNNVGTRLLLLDGETLSVFNPQLGSNYRSLNKLKFDEQTGRIYGGGSGLGYWQDNAWHALELPVDLGTDQYLFTLDIKGNYIYAATRESILLFDGNGWEVFTPQNSPLQHHNFYDSGFDALSGRIWITYNGIRGVDVYQTDFLVNTATPGNHLNPFIVTLSPNPATDLAIVAYELPAASAAQVTGRIYNLQGALLRSVEWDGSAGKYRQELNLGGLDAGVYLVEIVAGGQRTSIKLVKH